MACFAVPTAVAVLAFLLRRRLGWNGLYMNWFLLLFTGGALFGLVDHLWNGELLVLSENLASDLLLGVVISLSLVALWSFMVFLDKSASKSTVGSI